MWLWKSGALPPSADEELALPINTLAHQNIFSAEVKVIIVLFFEKYFFRFVKIKYSLFQSVKL